MHLLRRAFALFLVSIVSFNLSAQITSNFSTSADSWTVFDNNAGSSSAPTYSAAGGNPGGNTSFTTSLGYVPIFWTAPAKFLNNQSRSYNQTLTFDLLQSTAGTDNTQSDVVIVGSGGTLVYQLPAKPGTSWTSYSVTLNESQWHDGCATCTAPSQTKMKQVLATITKFQIRLKYLSGNTGPYTAQLDNVVLNQIALGSPPTITSFTPNSALAGATVTMIGTNFNTTAAQNVVYFNGIKGTVTNATATQLKVTVPTSASYGPITVANISTALQASTSQSFNPLFDNNKDFGGQIIPASLQPGYKVILPMGNSSNTYSAMDKGDLDGDGWIDLIASESGSTTLYVFRNLGTGGVVSTSSFGAGITLTGLATIPGGSPSLGPLKVADVDNDGKLDIAAITSAGSGLQGYLAVFRNTSTSGSISFASPQFFAYPYYSSQLYFTSGDIDSDGRIDFLFTTGTSPGGIWVSQNQSTVGNVDFAFGQSIGTTLGHTDVKTGDLDNDGKPEVIAGIGVGMEVYQNNSSAGAISLGAPFTVTGTSASYLAVADLDADNTLDLAWSAYGSQYIYFSKNNYSGTLNAAAFGGQLSVANTTANPDGLAATDINSDGKIDLVIVGSSDVGIMQNVGATGSLNANSFLSPTLFQGSVTGQFLYGLGPITADLDGDNKQEVIFVYSNSSITTGEKGIYIYHNESYPIPTISSTSPGSASVGTNVSLNGNYFYTGNVTPTIRFNKFLSTISGSPTNTLATVTNPIPGISGKFTLTNHGLTATSPNFKKTFVTNGIINSSSFGPSIDFTLANNTRDALEVADFDDDGKIDVVAVDNLGTAKIFQNASTAGQTISATSLALQSTTYTSGYNLVALDIDGDGTVDLNNGYGLLQNNSTPGSISFSNGPNGSYTYAGGFNYVASADFNKDGKIDLAVTNGTANIQVYENKSVKGVFQNNGNLSTFSTNAVNLTRPTNYGGIVAEDFDGDGYEDLIVANQSTANLTYYLNAKQYGVITTSSFTLLGHYSTSGSQPNGITANDFDGDGKIDIAVSYFNSAFVSVYRNNSSLGDISFFSSVDLPAANKGYNLTSQDLDGDGKAEIVVIHRPNPGPGSFTIFKNNSISGNASFGAGVNVALTRNPQAINVADINNDMKPDILIVGDGGSAAPANALMVFENKIATNTITITQGPLDFSACTGDIATFSTTATGTTNIAYQWQFSLTSIGPFIDIVNGGGYSNANTSTLSVNTTGNFGTGRYRCKITGDFAATVFTNDEGLFITTPPAAPTTQGGNACPSVGITLTASGGSNGQYSWYTVPTGGTAIPGETNSTYVTPGLTTTTTFYVSIKSSGCESARTTVVATVNDCSVPVITAEPLATQIGGKVTLDLKPLIATNNLDLASLQIVTPPSSGAAASIDANGILTIDYNGKSFAGNESITIKACDLNGQCTTQDFTIVVAGDIVVYNGVSANRDNRNDRLYIQYIEILPDTKSNTVYIFDRWENLVWHGENYDNASVVFTGVSDGGSELPSGVYFYKIDFASGKKSRTGFISLRR